MKTIYTLLVAAAVSAMAAALPAEAQGRRGNNGNGRGHGPPQTDVCSSSPDFYMETEVYGRYGRFEGRARFVFFPDFGTYYDRARDVYIVAERHGWRTVRAVPRRMRGHHPSRIYRVEIHYNGRHVQRFYPQHRYRYARH